MESKLSFEQIADLSFKNTESTIITYKRETESYTSWSSKSVVNAVNNLISIFEKEKKEFRELCAIIDDLPLKMLAFKNTESDLVSFQSVIFEKSWKSLTVRSWFNKVQTSLYNDKRNLKKLLA